jgi:hypothetical protein
VAFSLFRLSTALAGLLRLSVPNTCPSSRHWLPPPCGVSARRRLHLGVDEPGCVASRGCPASRAGPREYEDEQDQEGKPARRFLLAAIAPVTSTA